MLTETTVSKLREMRLSVMANALKDKLADTQFQNMAFENRIGFLVDAEWHTRKNNHLNKLTRQATFFTWHLSGEYEISPGQKFEAGRIAAAFRYSIDIILRYLRYLCGIMNKV